VHIFPYFALFVWNEVISQGVDILHTSVCIIQSVNCLWDQKRVEYFLYFYLIIALKCINSQWAACERRKPTFDMLLLLTTSVIYIQSVFFLIVCQLLKYLHRDAYSHIRGWNILTWVRRNPYLFSHSVINHYLLRIKWTVWGYGFVKNKIKIYCDRQSVGQFVLVSGPLCSRWQDFAFLWVTITFFLLHVWRPPWQEFSQSPNWLVPFFSLWKGSAPNTSSNCSSIVLLVSVAAVRWFVWH
jgi:hypothetical protein